MALAPTGYRAAPITAAIGGIPMSTHHSTGTVTGRGAPPTWLPTMAMVVGAVFLLVGVLGFIPGITTNYDDLTFAGHESDAKLLGIFEVSVLHNIVHLLFGIAGLVAARSAATAGWYLLIGGVVYAVLWVYGLVVDEHSTANFVPVNDADDWLHFVLAVTMIALGAVGLRALRNSVGTVGTTTAR
jgi:arginine exporter protein ArgO